MDHKVMSPQEVEAALMGESSATYVDVRTVAEFSNGHPKGKVVNIPLVFFLSNIERSLSQREFSASLRRFVRQRCLPDHWLR